MNELLEILPAHKCELTITHNPHKSFYQSIESYLAERAYDDEDYANTDTQDRISNSGEIWICQWYPNTPIGFNIVVAETLEELLNYFREMKK